jgi:hypothetical protein
MIIQSKVASALVIVLALIGMLTVISLLGMGVMHFGMGTMGGAGMLDMCQGMMGGRT